MYDQHVRPNNNIQSADLPVDMWYVEEMVTVDRYSIVN